MTNTFTIYKKEKTWFVFFDKEIENSLPYIHKVATNSGTFNFGAGVALFKELIEQGYLYIPAVFFNDDLINKTKYDYSADLFFLLAYEKQVGLNDHLKTKINEILYSMNHHQINKFLDMSIFYNVNVYSFIKEKAIAINNELNHNLMIS